MENDTAEPEWNEQISFIEMFPPLARKIKIQLLDDANIGDVALATHFIDLQQISDPGRNGEEPASVLSPAMELSGQHLERQI